MKSTSEFVRLTDLAFWKGDRRLGTFSFFYISAWGSACLLSIVIYLRGRDSFAFSHSSYWRFLLVSWKLITFIIASLGITAIAPYTGDPTWDYVDALFMSVLTFLSAPWVVGAFYSTAKRRIATKQAFVALCVWMFSASWSYDLYLLIRDGDYPITWWPNIFASSVLYVSAGLLWNLDWRKERGVIFSFMEEDWPTPSARPVFTKIMWFALPFMIMATILILSFVWP